VKTADFSGATHRFARAAEIEFPVMPHRPPVGHSLAKTIPRMSTEISLPALDGINLARSAMEEY